MEKGWSSHHALFTVGKIQAKFCYWGLTSFRHLGWQLLRESAEKQSSWIWGENHAPFSKTSSKLNYVMAISSFKPSAGQVGAGPRSEQYPRWVMGWGKDRSALLQEIPGNAGAPLSMSTVWLHHCTCQKPPWLSNRMMQLFVRVLQRYPLSLAWVRCLHVRILKRRLLNIIILTAFCLIWNTPLTVEVARCGENTAFHKDFCMKSLSLKINQIFVGKHKGDRRHMLYIAVLFWIFLVFAAFTQCSADR